MTRAASPAWQVCEDCGSAYGLPTATPTGKGTGPALCVPCHTEHLTRHAAHVQLEALTAPIVGAWASQWGRAGVPFRELLAMVEHATGADMEHEDGEAHRARTLRFLARAHPAPAALPEDAPPLRTAVDPAALPALRECRPAMPEHGIHRPYFVDDRGEAVTIFPTVDTLTFLQADGVRVLIFTGHAQRTTGPLYGPHGYRVPAHLWAHVEAVLNGEGVTA
ncbi:hypothetical protein [Deinococcus sp. JMULE3]|uniref:hypothetical protein n=1 Tax=Deinococcus sp. JMULE3 TaxID=2518341 RepID=UPI001575F818|nr:hypothetical protein [Deinococcus sp. JMULE3]NTY02115.1 hypothetical protein [Deinococcus sp. JMULE3]